MLLLRMLTLCKFVCRSDLRALPLRVTKAIKNEMSRSRSHRMRAGA